MSEFGRRRQRREPVHKYSIDRIVEYYGSQPLRANRHYAVLHCPFHDDGHPSAAVYYDKQRFRCFACDIDEDGVGLIQHVEGVAFQEAVAEAKRITGEGDDPVRPERGRLRDLFD